MRTSTTAIMTVGLLLATLTACSSSDQEDKAVETPKVVDTPKAPAYTVGNKIEKSGVGSVDLVIPTATVDSAKAAIQDYAKTIHGPLNYGINVIRSKADKGIEDYVCHGEWVKAEQAAQVYTGGRVTSDTWPAIGMYRSGPKG
ncbi:hypothetical protein GT030_11760 [Streptomyces sp. SID1328]|uniref:hypothetical protein n=1 Tax=Streptomyces sp. SID1328 TaxID=2690250 RepID=UPI00136E349E|nr:hypothetical protein [Streptomyces sp. SID1328]MYV39528.1 hypothetical protein [Streptomyces sp. SID1328]